MAETVYVLCALTSILCAALLFRAYRGNRSRLLLWSTLCFVGLALNNVFLFVDIVVVPDITNLNSANFDSRNYAIIEGEKAGLAAVPKLQEKVAAYYESKKTAVPPP